MTPRELKSFVQTLGYAKRRAAVNDTPRMVTFTRDGRGGVAFYAWTYLDPAEYGVWQPLVLVHPDGTTEVLDELP